VTAYVVVSAPATPVRTETVEWGEEDEDGSNGPVPARLVPGEMALAPGAAFSFVVPDPRRPLVHRITVPDDGGGGVPARIVGVEVRRGGGDGDSGEASPPPPPPFTLAASGPGFRVLRLIVRAGERCSLAALRAPAVAVTVRGGGGVRGDDDDGGGGEGEGARPPPPPQPSLLVRAARAEEGVAWTDEGEDEDAAVSVVVNAGPDEWECAVVEL
jgi:hypothetical protein